MEGHQDYPSQLLDGKIDAFSRTGSVPAAVVDEIAASKSVTLVDFGPELERTKFLEKHPFVVMLGRQWMALRWMRTAEVL
ncbi:MAG: hypothetical protein IT518_01465 [Burkholderiales bacterium]|nr:hypothetical protein [Burkholderiales bacterium]